jgi:hypothetical protein
VYIGDEESRIDDLYQVADDCAQSADDEGYSAATGVLPNGAAGQPARPDLALTA